MECIREYRISINVLFIEKPYLIFIFLGVGPNFHLLHNIAHTANIVQNYLNEFDGFLGVASSKPKQEHVWYHIGWAPQNRRVPPRTLKELEAVVTEEWNQVSPDYIGGLIESLPTRMQIFVN
ncbi:hypothetical protein QE152_g6602 [Popillia japonica]|uniref:Uncharacterized protein n=1 Tax=Popillia japonica TaxID=7064 RepID=A0AAW1MHP5_POPJA